MARNTSTFVYDTPKANSTVAGLSPPICVPRGLDKSTELTSHTFDGNDPDEGRLLFASMAHLKLPDDMDLSETRRSSQLFVLHRRRQTRPSGLPIGGRNSPSSRESHGLQLLAEATGHLELGSGCSEDSRMLSPPKETS